MKRDVAAIAAREHDLLVVGGGIYGVTAAFEAASRGLRVALVEAADFGGGASWNSLKTIHGGLRHLQRLDLASHRESVRERRLLLQLAPLVIRPLRFLVPAYGHGPKGREALAAGLLLDNLLALDRNAGLPSGQRLGAGRMLGRDAALAAVPGLPREGLAGAAVWTDAQMESERLLLGFLRAACEGGALAANHCPALELLQDGGRVRGARVRDDETGRDHVVRAACVLLAAGFRAAQSLVPSLPAVPQLLAMNLVLEGSWPLPERMGVGARSGGRFLFLVPWRDHILAGTDYRAAGERQRSAAREGEARPAGASDGADVRGFLAEIARAFPWAGIESRPVTLVHRGSVPGEAGPDGLWTRPRLVDHGAARGPSGLISLHGVKYTTARAVSERAVGLACSYLGRSPEGGAAPPRQPLAWARPLPGTLVEQTRAAVRDEMARTLEDAVLRRLDLGTAGPPPPARVDEVARVMAEELGWDEGRTTAERRALARFYEDAYNGREG